MKYFEGNTENLSNEQVVETISNNMEELDFDNPYLDDVEAGYLDSSELLLNNEYE